MKVVYAWCMDIHTVCMLHGGGVHGPRRRCMKVVCARCMTYESLVENYTVFVVSTVSNWCSLGKWNIFTIHDQKLNLDSYVYTYMSKGQSNEILRLRFFQECLPPKPLTRSLKAFWILLQIRGNIRDFLLTLRYHYSGELILPLLFNTESYKYMNFLQKVSLVV
jgi:hypothetical protein